MHGICLKQFRIKMFCASLKVVKIGYSVPNEKSICERGTKSLSRKDEKYKYYKFARCCSGTARRWRKQVRV